MGVPAPPPARIRPAQVPRAAMAAPASRRPGLIADRARAKRHGVGPRMPPRDRPGWPRAQWRFGYRRQGKRERRRATFQAWAATKAVTPRGGRVNSAEKGWPWAGIASAMTPPRLPTLLPP